MSGTIVTGCDSLRRIHHSTSSHARYCGSNHGATSRRTATHPRHKG